MNSNAAPIDIPTANEDPSERTVYSESNPSDDVIQTREEPSEVIISQRDPSVPSDTPTEAAPFHLQQPLQPLQPLLMFDNSFVGYSAPGESLLSLVTRSHMPRDPAGGEWNQGNGQAQDGANRALLLRNTISEALALLGDDF